MQNSYCKCICVLKNSQPRKMNNDVNVKKMVRHPILICMDMYLAKLGQQRELAFTITK